MLVIGYDTIEINVVSIDLVAIIVITNSLDRVLMSHSKVIIYCTYGTPDVSESMWKCCKNKLTL